jgi:predicted enzyme related to lactoylglutathione lyase
VIYSRPAGAPAGAIASLIVRVPNLENAIDAVKVNGGTLMRPPNRNAVMNLRYAFVKDPDGNQIELIMDGK